MSSVMELQLEFQIGSYINTSAAVLFLYESLITLSQEFDVIWSRQWTMMTWLFALMRYSTIVEQIRLLVPTWNFLSCKASIYIDGALQLIQYLCFACFSALRVYALLNGRHLISGIVLILSLVPFATNLFNSISVIVYRDSDTCITALAGSNGLHLSLSLATRLSVIVSDVVVLIVTWMQTAQTHREARRLGIKAPLASMLLRDGTLCFTILLIVNILHTVNINANILATLDIIEPFYEIVQPLTICRFILNLRQLKPSGSSWIASTGKESHSLRFVGNMGQSLQIGEEEDLPQITNPLATQGSTIEPDLSTETARGLTSV